MQWLRSTLVFGRGPVRTSSQKSRRTTIQPDDVLLTRYTPISVLRGPQLCKECLLLLVITKRKVTACGWFQTMICMPTLRHFWHQNFLHSRGLQRTILHSTQFGISLSSLSNLHPTPSIIFFWPQRNSYLASRWNRPFHCTSLFAVGLVGACFPAKGVPSLLFPCYFWTNILQKYLWQYICKPTRYTTFYDWVNSQHLAARHVSDLNGPSPGAFTSCMLRIWYVHSIRPDVMWL